MPMPETDARTDNELLAAYAAGSPEAFAEILRRYQDAVFSACRRILVDEHRAEDAAQAVFLVLARKAARLAPGTVLGGWLHLTAKHAALRLREREERLARREREAATMREEKDLTARDPADELAWAEIRGRLDEALDTLTAKQREAGTSPPPNAIIPH